MQEPTNARALATRLSGRPAPRSPGGPHLHSPTGWGAAVCGPAESGPNPGQGATLAFADLADWAECASASPSATRHYSWLAFIPRQGVTLGAARSLLRVLRKGWPEAGLRGGTAGTVGSCSEFSDHELKN